MSLHVTHTTDDGDEDEDETAASPISEIYRFGSPRIESVPAVYRIRFSSDADSLTVPEKRRNMEMLPKIKS